MFGLAVKVNLIFSLIKYVNCDFGLVTEVLINKKFHCRGASTEIHQSMSEIQCTHMCLRKKCKVFNYKNENGYQENCEVYSESEDCQTLIEQDGWKAIAVQVICCH